MRIRREGGAEGGLGRGKAEHVKARWEDVTEGVGTSQALPQGGRRAGKQNEGRNEGGGSRGYVHAIDQAVERLLVPRLQILFLLLLLLDLDGVLPHKG
jgi:hypothetical protein